MENEKDLKFPDAEQMRKAADALLDLAAPYTAELAEIGRSVKAGLGLAAPYVATFLKVLDELGKDPTPLFVSNLIESQKLAEPDPRYEWFPVPLSDWPHVTCVRIVLSYQEEVWRSAVRTDNGEWQGTLEQIMGGYNYWIYVQSDADEKR